MAEVGTGHDDVHISVSKIRTERMVKWLAEMQLVQKQKRAVTAGRAMRVIAATQKEDAYQYGFETKKQTRTFWSHSWRTPVWKKAGLLFLCYNGLAATIIASLGAGVPFGLSSGNLIPGYTKQAWSGFSVEIGPWCLLTGFLLFCIVVYLWRSQELVWIDLVCIHQTDAVLRQQGIRSLAGNIKNAKGMIVVWDDTWVDRLWCIFELAAFMKSQGQAAKQHLTILPTTWYSFWVAQFGLAFAVMLGNIMLPFENMLPAVLGLLGFLTAAIVLEMLIFNFYSQVDALDARLRNFSLDNTQCACCTSGHRDKDGMVVGCDKDVLVQCMCQWFGSAEACEANISSTVADALREKLGKFPYPYWAMLSTSLPLVWAYMDHAAARIREESWQQAGAVVLDFLAWYFNVLPAIATFTIAMVRKTRTCSTIRLNRWLCRIAHVMFHLLAQAGDRLCISLATERLQSEALFFAASLVPALAAWWARRI